MNTTKELALAKLMGWKLHQTDTKSQLYELRDKSFRYLEGDYQPLEPYSETIAGLAQFASILLRFSQVMTLSHACHEPIWNAKEPTQENILDEILRMNGVAI